ncbi:GerMN domain-containing protein [Williamsia sp. CHRR-6]|nr:GerMN domain-containing protein [Williamsia sp. CHRR-6]
MALVLALAAVLTGCVSIPDSSSPQPIGTLERRTPTASVPSPRAGMDPESLIRDFLKASANPTSGHLAARQYLTREASDRWDDRGSAMILEQISVLGDARTDTMLSARIIAETTGALQPNGELVPSAGRIEIAVTVENVNGQWRISSPLPSGTLIDRTQFTTSYRARSLYFPARASDRLVPDPRWVFVSSGDHSDQLVDLLVSGPSSDLAGAVRSAFPDTAALRGSITDVASGGVRIQFTGISSLSERDRTLLAAQIVWTLTYADIGGPYLIESDGSPLIDRYASGWRSGDVESLDPEADATTSLDLHAIRDGSLVVVDGDTLRPIPGPLGSATTVRSADISTDSSARIAAVVAAPLPDPRLTLQIGLYGGPLVTAATGLSITRPSLAADRMTVWAVVDGQVLRWARDATGAPQAPARVDAGPLTSRGVLTEFRVSPDGARIAAIVDGTALVGTLSTDAEGSELVSSVREAAVGLSGRTVSVDWISADSLVIARDVADTPILQVNIDGTPAVGLLSGNLTPPVRAVVGDKSNIYVADSRGILRLGRTNGEPDQYWNEVGATMGSAAIPVLP